MKNTFPMMEARTVALLLGLVLGLGIAVHGVFFLVALVLGLVIAVEWTVQKIGDYLRCFRLSYRNP